MFLSLFQKTCFIESKVLPFHSFVSPFIFLFHPLWFSSGWNRTWVLVIGLAPPSLWLELFFLPPTYEESSAVCVNPGLHCPAVCIPLLLGEHGTAPGPLCSHQREVNVKRGETGRERVKKKIKKKSCSWAVLRLSQLVERCAALRVIEFWPHTLSYYRRGKGEEWQAVCCSVGRKFKTREPWWPSGFHNTYCLLLRIASAFLLIFWKDLTFWFCNFFFTSSLAVSSGTLSDMESPTKEIEEFESTALKYLQPEQIEKIWLRLRGLWVYSVFSLISIKIKSESKRAFELNFDYFIIAYTSFIYINKACRNCQCY